MMRHFNNYYLKAVVIYRFHGKLTINSIQSLDADFQYF